VHQHRRPFGDGVADLLRRVANAKLLLLSGHIPRVSQLQGMPHKYYHGKTGVVWNVTKRAVGVEINKQVGASGSRQWPWPRTLMLPYPADGDMSALTTKVSALAPAGVCCFSLGACCIIAACSLLRR
jgi:Ribosomal protein L21e